MQRFGEQGTLHGCTLYSQPCPPPFPLASVHPRPEDEDRHWAPGGTEVRLWDVKGGADMCGTRQSQQQRPPLAPGGV